MQITPPVTVTIELTSKFCEYGGEVSVHIAMAGKELLRYECKTEQEAKEYIEHLEYHSPRLSDQKEWELTIFTDSGFQTLSLNAVNTPQCVMSHCSVHEEEYNATSVHQKVIHARNLAARYLRWYERRGWYRYSRVYKLEGILELLNTILRQPDIDEVDKIMHEYCSTYQVEKGVTEFSNRNDRIED